MQDSNSEKRIDTRWKNHAGAFKVVCVCEDATCVLCVSFTILVHGMRLRLLLANIGKGAYNGDPVGQFFVILVVVLFEQGLADPPPGIRT